MEAEERERALREAMQREMDAINQRLREALHGPPNGGLRPPR